MLFVLRCLPSLANWLAGKLRRPAGCKAARLFRQIGSFAHHREFGKMLSRAVLVGFVLSLDAALEIS